MSWENLFKDQGIFSLVIILLILITVSLDNVRILSGENWCWSLLGLKGLSTLESLQGLLPFNGSLRSRLLELRQGCHSTNSLTFPWPLNSFHGPFINEKQSMFPFSFAFFAAQLFPLFAERGRRYLEEIIHSENHWPQLLHKSGVEFEIDRFACFAAYFSSFPKENAFQSLEENL